MKVIFQLLVATVLLLLLSCSSNPENVTALKKTEIEGIWFKEGNRYSPKIIFKGNTFEVASAQATIYGEFRLEKGSLKGKLTSIYGDTKAIIAPYKFSGKYTLEKNKLTFSGFSTEWATIFDSWFSK